MRHRLKSLAVTLSFIISSKLASTFLDILLINIQLILFFTGRRPIRSLLIKDLKMLAGVVLITDDPLAFIVFINFHSTIPFLIFIPSFILLLLLALFNFSTL